jgi:hypothetical protein
MQSKARLSIKAVRPIIRARGGKLHFLQVESAPRFASKAESSSPCDHLRGLHVNLAGGSGATCFAAKFMRFCAARLPPGTRSAFHAVVLGQARDQPRSLINETLRRAIRFQRTHNLTLAHVPANFSFSLCGARAFSSAAAAAMLIKDAPHAKGKVWPGTIYVYVRGGGWMCARENHARPILFVILLSDWGCGI